MLRITYLKRIASILQKYIFSRANGEQLTAEEQEVLNTWLQEGEENRAFFRGLEDRKKLQSDLEDMRYIEARIPGRWRKLEDMIETRAQIYSAYKPKRSTSWMYGAAASCVVGIFGIGIYMNFHLGKRDHVQDNGLAKISRLSDSHHTLAELEYADGKSVDLDMLTVGSLLSEEGTVVKKIDSATLQYISGAAGINHTLRTPKGGRYTVILPDGSHILLNAATTIKYSTEFGAVGRVVELDGEAFFQVAHQASSPFVVHAGKQSIEDLSTRFDVKNYKEDSSTSTTLVQGSVRVLSGKRTQILRPGDQAQSLQTGRFVITPIDTFAMTAWITGRLYFTDQPLTTVMKQLSRWYNVQVKYKNKESVGDPTFGYSTVNSTASLLDVLSHINNIMNLRCSYDKVSGTVVVDK